MPHRPSPGRRSPTRAGQHRGPPGRGLGHGDRGDVDAQGGAPGGRQELHEPAGAAADVQHRALAPGGQDLVGRVHLLPSADVQQRARRRAPGPGLGDMDPRPGQRRVEQRRGGAGTGHQPAVQPGEPRVRGQGGDRRGVLGGVHVAQPRQRPDPQAEPAQPGQLRGAGRRRGHRHPEKRLRVVPAQADRPEPAVLAQAEDGVDAGPVDVEVRRGQLGGVHADEEGRLVGAVAEDVGEDVGEPLVQAVASLADHRRPGRQPRPARPVPGDDGARRCRRHRVEGVADRGLRQGRRLPRPRRPGSAGSSRGARRATSPARRRCRSGRSRAEDPGHVAHRPGRPQRRAGHLGPTRAGAVRRVHLGHPPAGLRPPAGPSPAGTRSAGRGSAARAAPRGAPSASARCRSTTGRYGDAAAGSPRGWPAGGATATPRGPRRPAGRAAGEGRRCAGAAAARGRRGRGWRRRP